MLSVEKKIRNRLSRKIPLKVIKKFEPEVFRLLNKIILKFEHDQNFKLTQKQYKDFIVKCLEPNQNLNSITNYLESPESISFPRIQLKDYKKPFSVDNLQIKKISFNKRISA